MSIISLPIWLPACTVFFSSGKPFFSLPPETSSRCSSYYVFSLLKTCRGRFPTVTTFKFPSLEYKPFPSWLRCSPVVSSIPYPLAAPICSSLNESSILKISMLLDMPFHSLKVSFCPWGYFSHLGRIISLRKPLNSSGDSKVSFSIAILPGTCFHYWIWCIIIFYKWVNIFHDRSVVTFWEGTISLEKLMKTMSCTFPTKEKCLRIHARYHISFQRS